MKKTYRTPSIIVNGEVAGATMNPGTGSSEFSVQGLQIAGSVGFYL